MTDKVPRADLLFWVVKALVTCVGATAADVLAVDAGLGRTATSGVVAGLTVVALTAQLGARRHRPVIYWACVLLISMTATLLTDDVVATHVVSLWVTTLAFGAALAATFVGWRHVERPLSIHGVVTSRTEAFYWSAVWGTFALGTSAGDLVSEKLDPTYLASAAVFGLLIALVAVAHFQGGLSTVLAFWTAYLLTHPFGASIGDYLTGHAADGGLGLDAGVTSSLFLLILLAAVCRFTVRRR